MKTWVWGSQLLLALLLLWQKHWFCACRGQTDLLVKCGSAIGLRFKAIKGCWLLLMMKQLQLVGLQLGQWEAMMALGCAKVVMAMDLEMILGLLLLHNQGGVLLVVGHLL